MGELSTSIREFVIKDALLDQHIEGKYRGDFAITEIRPSYYTTGGRLVVGIRPKLDSMTLDDVDNLSDEEAERLSGNEVDPLGEVPAIQQPTVAPAGSPPKSPQKPKPLRPARNRGRRAFSVWTLWLLQSRPPLWTQTRMQNCSGLGLAARRNRQAGHHGRPAMRLRQQCVRTRRAGL
ncbi:DUF3275 family protein [Pseudomonas aeruginosa]|nr:DUF3275 family protein [Pseudomonas aeruginosa]